MARAGWDRQAAEASRLETLERLHGLLADQVTSLESVGRWQAWLSFASSLHRYFSNTLLIWAQRSNATALLGYRGWQARGRQVRRGETAIRVLAPVTRRVPRLDSAGNPVRDERGDPVMHSQMVGVKPVSVFDVAQTDGEPLPAMPEARLLTGDAPPGLWDSLTGLLVAEGFTVLRGDCGGANGITMFDTRQVRVCADVDDAQATRTLCHEAAHVLMHAAVEERSCRGVREVEAESVAFLVVRAHQMESSQYTFNYVAGWAHTAAAAQNLSVDEVVRSTGQRVISTADRILQVTKPVAALVEEPTGDLAVEVSRAVGERRLSVAAVADRPVSWGRPELPRPRLVAEPAAVSVARPVSIGR